MTEHRESPLTLPKLCRARRDDDVYEVRVPKPIADRARLAIERMVALA
jgi:quinolinate synthase